MSMEQPGVFSYRTGTPDLLENQRRRKAAEESEKKFNDPYRAMNMLDVQEFFDQPEYEDIGFDLTRFEWDAKLRDRVDRTLSEKLLQAENSEEPNLIDIRRLRGLILAAAAYPQPTLGPEKIVQAKEQLRDRLAQAMTEIKAKQVAGDDTEPDSQAFNHWMRLARVLSRDDDAKNLSEEEILDELATRYLEHKIEDDRGIADYLGKTSGRPKRTASIRQMQDVRDAVYARLLNRGGRKKDATARPPAQSLRSLKGKATKPGL
jgi:hypothetical protein